MSGALWHLTEEYRRLGGSLAGRPRATLMQQATQCNGVSRAANIVQRELADACTAAGLRGSDGEEEEDTDVGEEEEEEEEEEEAGDFL